MSFHGTLSTVEKSQNERFSSSSDQFSNDPLGRERGIYQSYLERLAPYLAEFVGTFVLTTLFLANQTAEPRWSLSSNALMMVALISSFGHISGANLNPAISISLYLCGRMQGSVVWRVCLTHILGGACGAGFMRIAGEFQAVPIGPNPGYGAWDALTVEVIFTAMICFVFLNCMASPKNNPARDQNAFAALATGFALVAGGHASRGITGSFMNPAIAFGLQLTEIGTSVVTGWATFMFCWEIFGGFIAAGLYRIVRPRETPGLSTESEEPSPSAYVLSEFFGTFFIIFTKVMMHKRLSDNEPWAVAAAITAMIYSLRGVSGAHFNPAITLSVTCCQSDTRDWHRVITYVGAQVLAGVSATCVCGMVDGSSEFNLRPPNLDAERLSIMVAEYLFTFLVCYVMLTTSLPEPPAGSRTSHNNIAGIALGGAYLVGGLSVGKVSGSVLNPAVALGYSGLAGLTRSTSSVCLPYIFYQIFGALSASLAYSITHTHIKELGDEIEKAGKGPSSGSFGTRVADGGSGNAV